MENIFSFSMLNLKATAAKDIEKKKTLLLQFTWLENVSEWLVHFTRAILPTELIFL